MKSVIFALGIQFLQSISGSYSGKTCELSIRVGNSASEAEVLLVDHISGREFYLPIDFQNSETRRTRFNIENGKRMFHYEFMDYNPTEAGRNISVLLFEAVKTSDLSRLEYVEFGYRGPKDRAITWAVCEMK